MSEKTLTCAAHGPQPQTYVCQHIYRCLGSNRAIGFHWSRDDPGPYPDAWCAACEAARAAAGGEWTDEVIEFVHVTVLCAACYSDARRIALGGANG